MQSYRQGVIAGMPDCAIRDEEKTREELLQELSELRRVASATEEMKREFARVDNVLRMAIANAQEEKAKVEAIIGALGDGISIQDKDYRILFQNKALKELSGDHVGEYCYKAYKSRDSVCEECQISRSFEDGDIHRAERIRGAGKDKRYYEIISSPLRDSDGNIIAGIEVVRDITDRKLAEEKREKLIVKLQDALAHIKALKGLLPICSSCKRIRDDKGSWQQVEEYIRVRSDVEFSHSLCPDCIGKLYPEYYKRRK